VPIRRCAKHGSEAIEADFATVWLALVAGEE
jgi:hypothetical protein